MRSPSIVMRPHGRRSLAVDDGAAAAAHLVDRGLRPVVEDGDVLAPAGRAVPELDPEPVRRAVDRRQQEAVVPRTVDPAPALVLPTARGDDQPLVARADEPER